MRDEVSQTVRFAAAGAVIDLRNEFRRSRLGTLWRTFGTFAMIIVLGIIFGAILKGKPFLHHPGHDIVGDQLPPFHVSLGLPARGGIAADGVAKHVARGDPWEVPIPAKSLGLGSLSRSRRSKQDDSHGFPSPGPQPCRPRKRPYLINPS